MSKLFGSKCLKKFTQRREDAKIRQEWALRFLCVSASLRDKFLEFCFNNFDITTQVGWFRIHGSRFEILCFLYLLTLNRERLNLEPE
jgi:hypothetical protein